MSHLTRPSREELEQEADESRDRLFDIIEALDQRRQRIVNPGKELRKYALPMAGVGLVLIVGVVGAGLAMGRRLAPSRARSWDGFPPPWQAQEEPVPSLPMQILRKVTMSLVSLVMGELARRLLKSRLLSAPEARRDR